MLIEIGPRMLGRCELRIDGCTAKGFNIVKKVLLAKDGKTAWACQKCLLKQTRKDRLDFEKNKNRELSI